MSHDHRCVTCGTPLEGRSHRALYCRKACIPKPSKPRTILCRQCGIDMRTRSKSGLCGFCEAEREVAA